MILIADSGSTKTDWALVDSGNTIGRFKTKGINPFHLKDKDIIQIIDNELLPQISESKVEKTYFYGAGCNESQSPRMTAILQKILSCNDVVAGSDLIGAAIAVNGKEDGIVCILGTGANSGLFIGGKIVKNIPPLGYILGDEGSGAVLGKLFMNYIFKNQEAEEIRNLYLEETNQTYNDIIYNVYSVPAANRYLATAALFIGKHFNDYASLRKLVRRNFADFFARNIDRYGRKDLPLGFVGSIAWNFQDELKATAESSGYHVGKIIKSPIDGLIDYFGSQTE